MLALRLARNHSENYAICFNRGGHTTDSNPVLARVCGVSGAAADRDEAVTTALAGLNVLKSSTTYPLVLALFRKRATGQMKDADLSPRDLVSDTHFRDGHI